MTFNAGDVVIWDPNSDIDGWEPAISVSTTNLVYHNFEGDPSTLSESDDYIVFWYDSTNPGSNLYDAGESVFVGTLNLELFNILRLLCCINSMTISNLVR